MPSSSTLIKRLYPTTSASRTAVSLRFSWTRSMRAIHYMLFSIIYNIFRLVSSTKPSQRPGCASLGDEVACGDPVEHPDRRTRPARFLDLSGDLRGVGDIHSRRRVLRRLATVAQSDRPDHARGGARRPQSPSIRRLVLFATPLPRKTGALIIVALLLASRKITSRTMIATVGWPLLLLVAGLFGITGALNHVGVAAQILDFLTEHGLLPDSLLL